MSENPLYNSRSTGRHQEFSNPLHTKAVNLPEEEDDITAAKAKNNKDEDYLEPKDGACGGVCNPRYSASPPMRVSLSNNSGKPLGDEISPQKDAYLKGAKAKVRASNASQQKKFKRQRSGEKPSDSEEMCSLKKSEVPPSFDNPFYSDNPSRDQENPSEDPTYATIPALQGGRPALPPRTLQLSHEAPPETIEFDDDDTYEKVNFGDTEA